MFDLEAIGSGLDFAAHVAGIQRLLRDNRTCVIQAPPGSGKTTLVPPIVANKVANRGQKVIVTAPRRVAVTAGAARLSHLHGSTLPDPIGYTIRGDRKVNRKTKVEFLTPGVLLRRLITDPGLDDVAAVILDEVHERSLDMDLLVAMLSDLSMLRPELFLIAMSATAETQQISWTLHDAPVLAADNTAHPVEIIYRPSPSHRLTQHGVSNEFLRHTADVIAEAAKEHANSDILAFLPGRREIFRVLELVGEKTSDREVLPLYSGVDETIQNRIFSPPTSEQKRRIIIATDVAESALTVEGVDVVVDSCLVRQQRVDQGRKMAGLVTVSASQAACQQRAGRAGRLGPGIAYRCVDEALYAAAPAHPTPEIAVGDLVSAALYLSCWGTPGGKGLRLIDSFPSRRLDDAYLQLQHMGAVDTHHRATQLGKELATMPLHPALGRALREAAKELGPVLAAEIVALLALNSRPEGANLPGLLSLLKQGEHPLSREWKREVKRLRPLAGKDSDSQRYLSPETVGYVAGLGGGRLGYLDDGSYLLASGTRVSLPQGSPLQGSEWLIITDAAVSQTSRHAAHTGAVITRAAPIATADIEKLFPIDQTRSIRLDAGTVSATVQSHIGQITLSETRERPSQKEIRAAILDSIRTDGVEILPWCEKTSQLRARMAMLHAELGQPWPDVSDAVLQDNPQWVEAYVGSPKIADIDLFQALKGLAGPLAYELHGLAPETLTVPSGRQVRVRYPFPYTAGGVRLSVKLQECFGLRHTPTVLDGRVPVAFELLSPGGQVLALTSDFEFFWAEVYPHVRSENRGRYPKHPWPVDPLNHLATAATTRQLQQMGKA